MIIRQVPFAGYELPVQYEGLGVLKEHVHTRSKNCASLFDVSHMGQIRCARAMTKDDRKDNVFRCASRWHGKDAVKFLEHMVVSDLAGLKSGEAKLSLIMNEAGGIVDDTVITNAGSYMYVSCVVCGRSYSSRVAYLYVIQLHGGERRMQVEGHEAL